MTRLPIPFLLIINCIVLSTSAQGWQHFEAGDGALLSNNINVIYIDDHDVKWLGTDMGLVSLNQGTWKNYDTFEKLANTNIHDIGYELSEKGPQLWIASENGISVATIDASAVTSVTTYTTENSLLKTNNILSVTIDTAHARYFGTDNGLYILKDTNWHHIDTVRNLVLKDYNIITSGSCESDWWSYFGTNGGGAIRGRYDHVDGMTGETIIDDTWSGLRELSSMEINHIAMDGNNQIYSTNKGIAIHNSYLTKENWGPVLSSDQYIFQDGNNIRVLPEEVITCAVKAGEGDYWFGTKNGITRVKFTGTDTIRWHYTTLDGLSGNHIRSMAIDSKGWLWVATDGGIDTRDTSTEINEPINPNFTFTINPNPATDYFTINGVQNAQTLKMEIYDPGGILVFSREVDPSNQRNKIHLNEASINESGIYFIIIHAPNYRTIKKLIVLQY